MRRLALTVAILVLLPSTAAFAAELDELLQESREASYTAEQVISCSTPDGVRDAVIVISQSAGELHVGAPVEPGVEVASGYGGWSLVRDGSIVSSANVEEAAEAVETRYTVDEGTATEYLGRDATLFHLLDGDVVRAELVLDGEVGALLRVASFTADGELYCERRFISFEPVEGDASVEQATVPGETRQSDRAAESNLPESLAGFERLDVYEDEEGFVFAYYSDGFFSFAVFQTPSVVRLDGGTRVVLEAGSYTRAFTPGQVTFVWETRQGGMALVGDLPPDMHDPVLSDLPIATDPGLLQRLWRSLFG